MLRDGEWFDALGGITHVHGNLHRSPLPATAEHWERIRDAGVQVVFSMEEDVNGDLARAAGLDWRAHFWRDHYPPHPRQLDAFLDEFRALPPGARALVHCRAGWGRTGTAIACALIEREGWTAARALEQFWSKVPGAKRYMCSNGQAEFVHGFHARRLERGL